MTNFPSWFIPLLSLSTAIVLISFAIRYFVSRLETTLVAKGFWSKRWNLVKRFFFPLQMTLIAGAALVFVANEPDLGPIASPIHTVGKITLILALTMVATRIVNVIFRIYYHRLRPTSADDLRQRRMKTRLQYLEHVIDLFVFILSISAILLSFEGFRKFGGSLLASAGLASVIIGFAAQRSLGNLIAGFQIAFTQPIRLGDAVVVEGEFGRVEEINLTYVVIEVWDLRRLILPINYFLEKPFQNWTRTSADIIGSVFLYLDYSVPLEPLRAELNRVLKESKFWDGRTAGLQVTDASQDVITVRALMSARDSGAAWDLRCEVREKLIAFLQGKYPRSLPRTRMEIERPARFAPPSSERSWRERNSRAET